MEPQSFRSEQLADSLEWSVPQCHLGVGGLSQRFAHLHGNHYLLSVCPAVTLNDKALLVVRRSFGFVEADVNRVWGRICKAGSIARRAVRRSARNSDRHGASAFFGGVCCGCLSTGASAASFTEGRITSCILARPFICRRLILGGGTFFLFA